MRPSSFVTLPWSAKVKDLKNVRLFTNPSVKPSTTNTMLRMMLSTVRSSKKRSARMSPKVTPLSKNVPNGPNKSVQMKRRTSRNTVPKLNVRRSPDNCAVPPAVFPNPDLKNASTRKKPLSKKSQRKIVTWNPKSPANKSPNWFPASNLFRSVLIYLKKSALVPERTPERSKSPLSRNGATFLLLLLVWLLNFYNDNFSSQKRKTIPIF
uniref:Uncharacterized protein n=1 Tax=Lepeophtheirus salmonis TaxID=72036 RepID=A7TZC3_LEPSM|nr:hypothetical protein [Lepeophtheirus salmonis]